MNHLKGSEEKRWIITGTKTGLEDVLYNAAIEEFWKASSTAAAGALEAEDRCHHSNSNAYSVNKPHE